MTIILWQRFCRSEPPLKNLEFENRQLIRAFHLRDTTLVARLQRVGVALDIEEQLTHPRSPLRSVFLDAVLFPRTGPSTFILKQKDDQGYLEGMAQLRTRSGRPERVVVFMSPPLNNGNGTHAIWQRLLTHLCVQAAQWGSLRVYAQLPPGSEESQIFKNVGFLEYGQEEIYRLDATFQRSGIEAAVQLRPQHPSDGWGLQQLYATITPRPVQTAEGLAQGQWELTRRRPGEQGRRKGYVWEVNGEILAALHLRAGKRGYWIRTLLHPDASDQADALCRAALRLTVRKPNHPVYFAVRHYESGWHNILPQLGFELLTTRMLLVKPMTVRVREKTPGLLPTLEAGHTEGAASMMTHSRTMTQANFDQGLFQLKLKE